jgi:gas vesicle protein
MSSGKVLLGVLAGVAAGALIGILFAPDTGWNTRKRISKKADAYIDDLKDKFSEFLETISEKIEEAKGEVSDQAERADLSSGKSK